MAAKFEVFLTLSLKMFTHFTFPLELIQQNPLSLPSFSLILQTKTSTMGDCQLQNTYLWQIWIFHLHSPFSLPLFFSNHLQKSYQPFLFLFRQQYWLILLNECWLRLTTLVQQLSKFVYPLFLHKPANHSYIICISPPTMGIGLEMAWGDDWAHPAPPPTIKWLRHGNVLPSCSSFPLPCFHHTPPPIKYPWEDGGLWESSPGA